MSDDLLERLRGFEKAYPESVFVSLTRGQRKRLHEKEPGLQDCIAADMARHLIEMAITPAANEIERLTARVERLEARGIGGMQRDIRSLRTALRDCMDYFDVDNLTTQTKYEELASVLEETGMKT